MDDYKEKLIEQILRYEGKIEKAHKEIKSLEASVESFKEKLRSVTGKNWIEIVNEDNEKRGIQTKTGLDYTTPSTKKHTVVKQSWNEHERGWGIRPDGYSLHLTEEDRVAFIEEYWAEQPNGPAPDDYSSPDGSKTLADIKEDQYKKILASKNGIRVY